jgi:hypothetical protein
LGFLSSSGYATPISIYYAFTNNTGQTITSLTINWNYEKYRSGTRAFNWTFFHGNTANPSTAATAGNFSYAADLNNTTISNPPLSTNINFTLTGLNIATGSTYYFKWTYTGVGGSSNGQGLSIDDFKIAANVSACTTPTAQATSLTFGSISDVSIAGSFTVASPAPNSYLVVASNNSTLTTLPVDGTTYSVDDALGDATVVAVGNSTSFVASGLSASTTYYFFIFSLNDVCSGGPKYLTTTPLTGNTTTTAGGTACSAPTAQATSLTLTAANAYTINGSFTAASPAADEYLVVMTTGANLSVTPVNGTTYNAGDALGNGTIIQRGNNTSFTASSLTAGATYKFFVFSLNAVNCTGGPTYYTTTPLTGQVSTPTLTACTAPLAQPTTLTLTAGNTSISGSFTASATADYYLTILTTSSSFSGTLNNGTDYTVGASIGNGTVVSVSSNTNFVATGLTASATYYFFVFAMNKICSGGTKYLTTTPLTGSTATTAGASYNHYYGNFHAHSSYSDGNKDNTNNTPAIDYAFADVSLDMDFLGISEHNHYGAGTKVAEFRTGPSQADTYTAAHAGSFLALYGMEWGVISGGGHVLVYSNVTDSLVGWETGSGTWGSSDNYDIYVAKSNYTGADGLFEIINRRIATKNTFATLAHPNSTDYNNLSGVAYDASADMAVVGAAVETGPAFSTDVAYGDPSTMSLIGYYQKMLSKGYHLGPLVDHDNHYTTFGRTAHSRTVVIAPTLTKSDLISAMRAMRFYATEDCSIKVDFTIGTKMMGSIVTARYTPVITAKVMDKVSSAIISGATIKVMYGVPGSGSTATQIYSGTGNIQFTHAALANLATGYYYLDITYNALRTVTSPIWYTRDDNVALPVVLSNFNAALFGNGVKLNWQTIQEINSLKFIVERSSNGVTWNEITSVKAAGNSNTTINYDSYDASPLNGINYYRLKQVDIDGKTTYFPIRKLNYTGIGGIWISPNPTKEDATVNLPKNFTGSISIELSDLYGRVLLRENKNSNSFQLSLSALTSGVYVLKVSNGKDVLTSRVVKE